MIQMCLLLIVTADFLDNHSRLVCKNSRTDWYVIMSIVHWIICTHTLRKYHTHTFTGTVCMMSTWDKVYTRVVIFYWKEFQGLENVKTFSVFYVINYFKKILLLLTCIGPAIRYGGTKPDCWTPNRGTDPSVAS